MAGTTIQYLLGDLTVPAPYWTVIPKLNTARVNLLSALFATPASVDRAVRGDGIVDLLRRTELVSLCSPLDADVATNLGAARNSLQQVSTLFTADTEALGGLVELQSLGVPAPYIDMLERYLDNPSPLYAVSAVAAELTLAAILLKVKNAL